MRCCPVILRSAGYVVLYSSWPGTYATAPRSARSSGRGPGGPERIQETVRGGFGVFHAIGRVVSACDSGRAACQTESGRRYRLPSARPVAV